MPTSITSHTIVKNEDRWIWYTLTAVIDFVDQLIVYDTGSTDTTKQIIRTINSPKLIFATKPASTRAELVKLRRQQLRHTQTKWFLILDGDEIWPQPNLLQLIKATTTASKDVVALYNRTRNAVGDIYHYLPESQGKYHIQDKTGHLNIRLIRHLPGLKVTGQYPLETYTLEGTPIQQLETRLQFVDTWYLHTTHLPRSTQKQAEASVIDRLSKRKFRFGLKMPPSELPQVFWQHRPTIVPPPITNRWKYLLRHLAL